MSSLCLILLGFIGLILVWTKASDSVSVSWAVVLLLADYWLGWREKLKINRHPL